MKSLETLIRLSENSLKELRFQLFLLQEEQKNYEKNYTVLSEERKEEEEKLTEQTVFFFPSYVQATLIQQKKILSEIKLIENKIDSIMDKIIENFIELKKFSLIQERDKKRKKIEFDKKEEKDLEDIHSKINFTQKSL